MKDDSIKAILERLDGIAAHLDKVETGLGARLDKAETGLAARMDDGFATVNQRLDRIETVTTALERHAIAIAGAYWLGVLGLALEAAVKARAADACFDHFWIDLEMLKR